MFFGDTPDINVNRRRIRISTINPEVTDEQTVDCLGNIIAFKAERGR